MGAHNADTAGNTQSRTTTPATLNPTLYELLRRSLGRD